MVAGFLISILSIVLFCYSVCAAPTKQLCLTCHPVHYVQQGSCTGCHRGNPGSDRKNIAHQHLLSASYARFTLGDVAEVREGKRLIDQYACRRCHVIGGRGNRLSANLDHSTLRKMPEELTVSIRQPVQNMPDFRLDKTRAVMLVNALLAARQSGPGNVAGQQVIHFDQGGQANQDLFSRKCGSCHRALTARLGALGTGDAGPNLSGMFSPFYPETFKAAQPWTVPALGEWLKNPRAIKPWARMQPISLSEVEFNELVSIMKMTNGEGKRKEE